MTQLSPMLADHWQAVREIYRQGIATGLATLEQTAPDWSTWDASHRKDCRLIALQDETVVGWAALSNVSSRCVYAGVAEVSVYVAVDYHGQGIGKQLLTELIEASEQADIWTLQAGIYVKNQASIKLHERCGFRVVGVRERLGKAHDGVWWDVALLERRSQVVGVD